MEESARTGAMQPTGSLPFRMLPGVSLEYKYGAVSFLLRALQEFPWPIYQYVATTSEVCCK